MMDFESVIVDGRAALDEWRRLMSAGRGYPVVVGNDRDFHTLYQTGDDRKGFDVSRILSVAAGLSVPACLPCWSENDLPSEAEWPKPDADEFEMAGTSVVSWNCDERVHILLLPTSSSWEVPAYLRFGGWNACPLPEVHVATLRSWHERFGWNWSDLALIP